MSFIPSLEHSGLPAAAPARWFLFREGSIVLDPSLEPPRWTLEQARTLAGVEASGAHYLGRLDGEDCYAAEMAAGSAAPAGLEPTAFRYAVAVKDEVFFRVASQASQLLTWAGTHRFCGRCGTGTEPSPGERATKCPACGLLAFPRVSPAVIVTVLRGEQILLARVHRFATGMYSVLAGFVEAGETLEECVHREILEETAVEVDQVRYFGSQSWPFPHSLMVAFVARHRAGEITIDGKELADAGWYGRDNLPQLPLKASIARRMIDWYRDGAKEE